MEHWPEDKQRDFIHYYQDSLFKENNHNSFIKCQFKRQSTHQIVQAAQHVLSNETTCHILKGKLQDYSSVVDKHDGVNNYANGVLDLVSHSANEAQSWKSTAKASDLMREFLQPLPGDCHNKSADGCANRKPLREELETFLKNKKPFQNFLNAFRPTVKPGVPRPVVSSGQNPLFASGKSPNQLGNQSAGLDAGIKQRPESRVMNAIEERVFGAARGGGFNQKSIPDVQPKPPSAPLFRTAGTELKLQNMKKYGQQAGTAGSSARDSAAFNVKKSLGGRTRTVNSKFVPPIKSDSQEDMDSQPNSCDEDMANDQLRLVDPKLVELIRSEIMDHGPPVQWHDIAGLHYAKATIQEIVVLPMIRPDIFTGLRRPPKGILLFGPPGTGKTLIGKCIASQSKSTFFNISASSLTSKWVGEGEKMVRTLFTLARLHQPAVVFIDEIDSLLSQRSETEHESSRRIKTEFLVQLDGAGTGEDDRILVIGATNRPQELDEAARRRLVKRLYIPLPDLQARCEIVRNLMSSEQNVLNPQHVEEVASLTDGYSGADMKVVCQEACLGPIRAISFSEMQNIAADQVRPVTVEDFKTALSRVRSSVSPKDLEAYVTWNQTYGSGGAPK